MFGDEPFLEKKPVFLVLFYSLRSSLKTVVFKSDFPLFFCLFPFNHSSENTTWLDVVLVKWFSVHLSPFPFVCFFNINLFPPCFSLPSHSFSFLPLNVVNWSPTFRLECALHSTNQLPPRMLLTKEIATATAETAQRLQVCFTKAEHPFSFFLLLYNIYT